MSSNQKRRRNNRRRPNNHKRNHKGKEGGNEIVRAGPRFPKTIIQKPIQVRSIRYITNMAYTNQQITPTSFLKFMLAVTNGSTTAIQIADCIRISGFSFYYTSSSGFDTSTNILSFSWVGSLNGPDNMMTDRGTVTEPACIKVRTPRWSPIGYFYNINSSEAATVCATFSCPSGTIIDVHYEYVIADGATSTVTLNTAATFTGIAYLIIFNSGATGLIPDGGLNSVRT